MSIPNLLKRAFVCSNVNTQLFLCKDINEKILKMYKYVFTRWKLLAHERVTLKESKEKWNSLSWLKPILDKTN